MLMLVQKPPRFDPDLPASFAEPPGKLAVLNRRIRFIDSFGWEWIAEAGSESDGASVPRFLWELIGHPFESNYIRGAWLHDVAGYGLSREDSLLAAYRCPARALADAMLREAALVDGTGRLTAWALYRGVRLGGAVAFAAHGRENQMQSLPSGGPPA